MKPGSRQFMVLAIAGVIFLSMVAVGIAGNITRGNYIAIPIVVLILGFAVGAIWGGIWFNQRRVQAMFRYEQPDRLLAHYRASRLRALARKIPNAEAAAADLSSLALTIYGQFDRAREELAAVDWEQAPVLYRARRLDTLALIALLEAGDRAQALQLAHEAASLEKPGAPLLTTPLRDAILIVSGEADAGALKRAQRAAGRSTGAIPAVSAWALSLYCERNEQAAEAKRWKERVHQAAPHFVVLNPSMPA